MRCRCSVTSCLSRAAMVTERKKTIVTCPKTNFIKFSKPKQERDSKRVFLLVYFRPIARTRCPITCGKTERLGSLTDRRADELSEVFFGQGLRSLYKV